MQSKPDRPIVRITDAKNTPDHANGGRMIQQAAVEYSTVCPFNADNSRLLLVHGSYFVVYDGQGTYLHDGTDAQGRFVLNAASQPRWSRDNPDWLIYFDGAKMMQYHVPTRAASTYQQFAGYTRVDASGEGDVSPDGHRIALMGLRPGGAKDIFLYDLPNKVIHRPADAGNADNVHATFSGEVIVNAPTGINLYDSSMRLQRDLTRAGGHADLGFDADGDPALYWVSAAEVRDGVNTNSIYCIRLADGRRTQLLELSWDLAVHISATHVPGLIYVSTYSGKPRPTGKYANQILRIENGRVEALADHHSEPLNAYTYQPKVASSADGSKIVWMSNDGDPAPEYADVYLMDLGADKPDVPEPGPIVVIPDVPELPELGSVDFDPALHLLEVDAAGKKIRVRRRL